MELFKRTRLCAMSINDLFCLMKSKCLYQSDNSKILVCVSSEATSHEHHYQTTSASHIATLEIK